MADITMCKWVWCSKAKDCYRHMAKINEYRQSFFMFSPWVDETCEYFLPNDKIENEIWE